MEGKGKKATPSHFIQELKDLLWPLVAKNIGMMSPEYHHLVLSSHNA